MANVGHKQTKQQLSRQGKNNMPPIAVPVVPSTINVWKNSTIVEDNWNSTIVEVNWNSTIVEDNWNSTIVEVNCLR
jgi:hypothetical protein